MSQPVAGEAPAERAGAPSRKEKRKALKKLKRKQARREAAIREREEEEARANDPEEQLRIRAREQEEAEAAERGRREFEERERIWLEAAARRAEAAAAERAEEEARQHKVGPANESEEDDGWEYVEEGPAEIIWKGNEIIVKKKRVRVEKNSADHHTIKEDDDRPTSNPLPPQSAAFSSYKSAQSFSAKEVLEIVAQQTPNFGTEQDKAHCPFHLKTGACRFGLSCSRLHFYPDKSSTLLIKNMYNGPGLAWEQDEGLEYTDEEVERCYEEFYEDVHTEFLKFGELLNFKVCKNGSHHLRGNVYVHYKSLDSAIFASNAMNGRFFAGKQILCEFVGVSRWKVAICGEYMKSKFRTCSRGTACNFIHCFHNPGGDYEWADWDNPPPRYWIKKMAALFGPSVEAEYKEQMKLEQYERPRDPSRTKTPTINRYRSRRSSYGEIDTHNSGSIREDSDEKKKGCRSRSPRGEHSSKTRKRIASQDRQELHKEKYKTDIRGYGKEYYSRFHSSDEDSDSPEDHQRYTKRYKTEDLSRPEKVEASKNEQGKSRNKNKTISLEDHGRKHRSSDRISDNINGNGDSSNEPSSDKYGIDVQDRYEGTYADLGFDEDSHEDVLFHGKKPNERRQDRPTLQPYRNHISDDHEQGSKKGRVCEKDSSNHRFSPDESIDKWKTITGDVDYEETHRRSASNGSRESSRKHSINSRERKHRREKECNQTEERYTSSDSENLESSKRVHKKHSRSQTPTHSSRSSRRRRSHNRDRS